MKHPLISNLEYQRGSTNVNIHDIIQSFEKRVVAKILDHGLNLYPDVRFYMQGPVAMIGGNPVSARSHQLKASFTYQAAAEAYLSGQLDELESQLAEDVALELAYIKQVAARSGNTVCPYVVLDTRLSAASQTVGFLTRFGLLKTEDFNPQAEFS